jgi:hypothetical protein
VVLSDKNCHNLLFATTNLGMEGSNPSGRANQ